ncbi:MAG: glutamate--tRNA ligase [bacterium]|nr:glutamate--tRNA ligase [bacterium]
MFSSEELKFAKPGAVRTRIAPSPTGLLHIGLARTALFNYLFAKQCQGSFVLRIEDTDLERSSPEYENDIIENLKWLGINWDEGPDISGKYGPYRQRERLDTYKKYLDILLKDDKAYYCFCSEEELEVKRQYQMSQGEAPRYSGKCANLPKETVKKYLAEGKPSVIRFRVASKKVSFNDLIRGRLEFDMGLAGDIVIAKDVSTPLYNFAVVIDDFEMKISHVIRGEEHISNTPKQILMQEALGFPRPEYGHLPLILGTDRTKLSKRHGAFGITDFRREGYLPEAIINYMAFLGWNPGDEKEIYSLPSLVKEFSLEKVQKGGAIFNIKKLESLNGFYIRQRSIEKITELCLPYFIEAGLIIPIFEEMQYPPAYGGKQIIQKYKNSETEKIITLDVLQKIISIYHERLKKNSEIVELADFFFKEKLEYDKKLLKWKGMNDGEVRDVLNKLENILSEISENNWTKENLGNVLLLEAERIGPALQKDRGYLLWPLRVALTGKEASAGPFEIAEILGKEKTLNRIKTALYKIS